MSRQRLDKDLIYDLCCNTRWENEFCLIIKLQNKSPTSELTNFTYYHVNWASDAIMQFYILTAKVLKARVWFKYS